MKTVLHVGCGNEPCHPYFKDFKEIRYDIDPSVNPDICGSIVSIPLPDNEVDVIYCSHNLEHVYEHEVHIALKEFYRILKPDGELILIVPDLQLLTDAFKEGKLDMVIYESPAGPIRACDMLWGHAPSIQAGNHFMAHKFGFTQETLARFLTKERFRGNVARVGFDLIANVQKPKITGGGT